MLLIRNICSIVLHAIYCGILRLNLSLIEFRLDDGAPILGNRNFRLWALECCWSLPNLDWDADHVAITLLGRGVVLDVNVQRVVNLEELRTSRASEFFVQDRIMVSPIDESVRGRGPVFC